MSIRRFVTLPYPLYLYIMKTEPPDSSDDTARIGRWMIYLAWLAVLMLVTWLFSGIHDRQYHPNRNLSVSADAEVVLKRNRWGHYIASGYINDTAVTFMLDTGATDISVPVSVADRLALERGGELVYQTANGPIRAWSTRLSRVGIGPIELRDLRAHINPNTGGDEILLGMAFLKHLDMTQRGDTLSLRLGRNQ